MPQLDPMLRALADRGAVELRLTDGARPTFRFQEGDRPVSKTVLRRAQIVQLAAELVGGEEATRLAAGEAVRFVYRLADGTTFSCEWAGDGSFAARVGDVPEGPAPVPSSPIVAPAGVTPPPAAASTANGGGTATAPTTVASPGNGATASAPGAAPAIDALLRHMVDVGASDLHLSADEIPILRLHGDVVRIENRSASSPEATWALLREIIPSRNLEEFEETNDTDFAYEIEGLARFRANVFRDRKGVGGVFRVIPSDILTAEQLGLSKAILDLCHLPKGLVLVTGPTGSGKSTTLAAMVDYINQTRTDHIITIEDPIEFVHPNKKCLVNQREVKTHTDGFKRALRAALREDPDIVLVGEMRDLETIEIAIETAETGHLVFGTLHTTTACSTVDRIIDQFPTDRQAQIRTMLSESLKGVVAQTLLKKIGGGRVAALEVLIGIPAIANLIREGKTFQIPSIMQTGKKHGMVLLNEALADLVKRKLVAPDDAYRKAVDRSGFAGMMRSQGITLDLSHEG